MSFGRAYYPLAAFALLYTALYAAYGAESPFLPSFMRARGLRPEQIGFVFAAGTIVRVIAGPIVGRIADRLGATRFVLGALLAASAGVAVLYLLARSFPVFVAVGATHAFVSAPVAPFADTLALAASRAGPAFEYGWVRGIGSAAFVVSTLASGHLIGRFGFGFIVVSSAALLGFAAACVAILPRNAASAAPLETDEARPSVRALLGNALFLRTMATAMLVMGSHTLNDTFAVIRWNQAGIGAATASVLWSTSVASEVLVFSGLGRPLIRRLGTAKAALLSAAAGVVRWSLMASTTAIPVLAGAQLLHGLTFALLHLVCVTVIDRSVPPALAATAQTTYNNFCLGIASAVFTSAAGILYGAFGPLSFWFAAALCLSAAPLAATIVLNPSREGHRMNDGKQEPKTDQPFSDELNDTSSPGVGDAPKPRADAVDDPKKKAESPKTTQRTE